MKFVKQFFKDFWNLPKHEFGRKYLLLPATLTCLCATILLSSRILTPLQSLTRTSGTVVFMDSVITGVKNKFFYKRVDKDLKIHLANETKVFRLSSSNGFEFIISKFGVGDHVTIYTDPPFDSFLFGKNRRILQFESHGETIIDFEKQKESYYFPVAILVLATLGFGYWYFYRRRKAAANSALNKALAES